MALTRSEITARYDAKNARSYALKLNRNNDADIIEKLSSVPSMQGYIKQLIREDLKRNKSVPVSDSVPVQDD